MSDSWHCARAGAERNGRAHLYQEISTGDGLEIRLSCRRGTFKNLSGRKIPRTGSKRSAAVALLAFPEGQRCTICAELARRVVKED